MGAFDDYILNPERIAPRGDDNFQLRRMLYYLAGAAQNGINVNLSGVEIKDGVSDLRAKVINSTPAANANALVVRPIGSVSLSGSADIQGTQAHSDVLTANPVISGARAIDITSLPAPVSFLDLAYISSDEYGRIFSRQANTVHTADTMGFMRKATAVDAGYLFFRNTAVTNTAVAIKASAGNLYSVTVSNPNLTDTAYACFYDTAAAGVTVGTTALSMSKVPIAPNTTVIIEFEYVRFHSTAIAMAATKNFVDSDNTAPSSALTISGRYL